MRYLVSILCVLAAASRLLAGVTEDYAAKVAPLIDPAKLATLGQRGANTRVQKAVYWLEIADGWFYLACACARLNKNDDTEAALKKCFLAAAYENEEQKWQDRALATRDLDGFWCANQRSV